MVTLLLADPSNNTANPRSCSRPSLSSGRMTNHNKHVNNPVTMMRVRTGELLEQQHSVDDDSTIGTTATNKQQQQQQHYGEEEEGLEIAEFGILSSSSSDHHNNNNNNNNNHSRSLPWEAPPPRPLSPVLWSSSSSSSNNSRRQDEDDTIIAVRVLEAPVAHHPGSTRNNIPSAIPPRPTPHSRRRRRVATNNMVEMVDPLSAAAATATATATPTNTPVKSNNSSTYRTHQPQQPTTTRGLWHRCAACYCMPHTTTSSDHSSTVVALDEPSEYYVSSFLPQLLFLEATDDDDDNLHRLVPKLCARLSPPRLSPTVRRKALDDLAQLCDRDHVHHRIPLVCCSTYRALTDDDNDNDDDTNNSNVEVPLLEESSPETNNDSPSSPVVVNNNNKTVHVIEALCRVLGDPALPLQEYRQALLIMSNLTLPLENKAVLLLGPHRELVLQTLWEGLHSAVTVVGIMDDDDDDDDDDPSRGDGESSRRRRTSISTANALLAHKPSVSQSTTTTTTTNEQQRTLEVHLILAILYNLSFLYDGIPVLAEYVPPRLLYITETQILPLDHPDSLLRVLERMLVSFQPLVAPRIVDCDDDQAMARYQNGGSVERQCMRWAFGIIRNLCVSTTSTHTNSDSHGTAAATSSNNRTIVQWIGATQIPLVALQVLRYTPTSDNYQGQWRPQSLEDLALGLWVELALREEEYSASLATSRTDQLNGIHHKLCPALYDISCQEYLQPLIHAKAGGIHSVRARAIVKRFDGVDLLEPMVDESRKRRSSIVRRDSAATPATAIRTAGNKSSGNGKNPRIHTKEDGYQYYCDDDTHNDTSTKASV